MGREFSHYLPRSALGFGSLNTRIVAISEVCSVRVDPESRATRPLTLAIIVLRSRRAAEDGKEVEQRETARSENGVAAA
jgi:hypothetical protein